MKARIRAFREKVREILDREAKVRDLVKATLPLWVSTVLGVVAAIGGFAWYLDQREADQFQACVRGRGDIAEFVHRLIDLNTEPDPDGVLVLEELLADFVADCA